MQSGTDTKMSTDLLPLVSYQIKDEKIAVIDEDQTTKTLSISEFNDKFKISMVHGIFYKPEYQTKVDAMKESINIDNTIEDRDKVKAFLNDPKNYFTVVYINQICGFGTIANQNIPEKTVVGIYSAEILDRDDIPLSVCTRADSIYDMNYKKPFHLRGLKYGDLTRFSPHLPTNVKYTNFDSTIDHNDILTANMTYPMVVCDGIPIRYFITTKAIHKGELAGIDYGYNYWCGSSPASALFVKNGNEIKMAYFDNKKYHYSLSNETISNLARKEEKQSITSEINKNLLSSSSCSFYSSTALASRAGDSVTPSNTKV